MFEFDKYQKILTVLFYATALFFLFNFKFEGSFEYIISEIAFVGYCLYILTILRSGIFKYIYEPPVFFLLFSFIYEVLKFPYYFKYSSVQSIVSAAGLGRPKFQIADYYGNSALLLLYQIICITILMYVYQLIKNKQAKTGVTRDATRQVYITKENKITFICVLFLLGGAIGLYSVTGGNLLFLLTRRAGNEEAGKILKDNAMISFSAAFVLIIIPIIIGFKSISNKSWKHLLIIYIPAMVLAYIVSGGRGPIIYSIASVFIILSAKKDFSFSIIKLTVISGSVIILFSFLGLIRRSFTDTSNILENIRSRTEVEDQWYYELSGYQLQFRDEMVFANADRAGFLLGNSYLNLVFFLVPRSVMGESKPPFIDFQVCTRFWGRDDIGLPLNAMGEAYFNFGYFGILVFVLLGFIMAKITLWLSNSSSTVIKYVGVVLLFYAETWCTTYLVYALLSCIVLSLALRFVKEDFLAENDTIPEIHPYGHAIV